ncbi:putative membrane protein [Litorivivens lipolytica]|uniref:Putative membrane protein n=1 Tax=Litorivivens lipolytica TaxID=1524264 RepID=A0A7W4W5C1_9GAMM|nr:urate hydroxylase PuuD [Litorivivens lipolytica]MBB3047737.1 putative membrane protein [Litorivivens lipolytica]
MENFITIDLLFRWLHVLFGITWIGLLYYFNFVQTEYFKEAEAGAKADAVKKLAPRALWWFRWGAMFTFLTGVVLLEVIRQAHGWDSYIIVGAVLGTLMFLNVWLIIWPNQKIVCGITPGDAAAAAPKAGLASRTNTLFSGPMLIGMMGSFHGTGAASYGMNSLPLGLWIALALIAALELNAIFGKTGPMTTVKGVIHCSIGLSVVILALLQFV